MHKVADEANEGKYTCTIKVNDLVTDEVRERYRNLTDDQREEILADHCDYRNSNATGSYITDKSDHHAARAKLDAVDKLLDSLQEQHSVHFLFIAVPGTPTSYVKRHITITSAVERFWVLSCPEAMHTWSTRLESFCVGGIHELLIKDQQSSLDIRGQIRVLLGQKLAQISGDPKATMSYARYERDIVDRYGIILEGWPFPVLRNLADERASNTELALLHRRLANNECFFRKLTDAEIEARADCPDTSEATASGKKRATRSDKGTKRGPQRGTLARRAASVALSHTNMLSTPNTEATGTLPAMPI
ncbi:hypothetical protein FS749_016672 [Ceratobasidium sp. UAMH 11750]|nr:hypothetical protein FS749_016672 [Ceratobasidium sp. UAMH 11750]